MAGTCGYGEGLSGFINARNFLTNAKFTVSFSRRTLLHGVSNIFLTLYIKFYKFLCTIVTKKMVNTRRNM
jgi:hypothetical protein